MLPLTQIVPLPEGASAVADVERCEAVAVTSINALKNASPTLLKALLSKPIFAVGDATAQAARDLGLTEVQSADGAADHLAALIAASVPGTTRIAYLCGRIRTGELEAALRSIGCDPVLIETYDTQKVSQITDDLATFWRLRRPDAVLFHSGVAASVFCTDMAPVLLPEDIEKTQLFAISARVAQLLPMHLAARTVVADAPRDDALIAAVRARLLGNRSQGMA